MKRITRLWAAVLVVLLLLPAVTALASDNDRATDRDRDQAAVTQDADQDRLRDQDQTRDEAVQDRDRLRDRDEAIQDRDRDRLQDQDEAIQDRDRDRDRVTDRPVCRPDERPAECCEHLGDDNANRWCPNDHIDLDDPQQVRSLAHRLIEAHQWQMLFRLLHAIGII